jgi:hypothetical protein
MKTAVEFLIDTWVKTGTLKGEDMFQAKEMEKEQIIDTWDDAYDKGTRDRIEKISNPVGNAEQYYNETFKNESNEPTI